MQEIRSSNPPVVTGTCDPSKSRAQHHHSLKLGLKLKYLNMIFCSFSFILFLVPIVSFCSYLILVCKRMHLIHKPVVFKGWPKHLQRLCILFYRIKNFFSPPTPAIKFSRTSQPPIYSNLPSINHSRVYDLYINISCTIFLGLENGGILLFFLSLFKGCLCHIFAILFLISKREKERIFFISPWKLFSFLR